MFKNLTLSNAAIYSAVIILLCLFTAILLRKYVNRFCQAASNVNSSVCRKLTVLKALILALFSVVGLFAGNLINIMITFNTAVSHGMTLNEETRSYDIPYGKVQMFNKHSIKETSISVDELRGQAVIFVRYDCPDCAALHDQLANITDMIFLSSRSERGKAVRQQYNIHLTEIPQGVYIDENGNSLVVDITQRIDETLTLDLHQLSILREMAAHRVLLTSTPHTLP